MCELRENVHDENFEPHHVRKTSLVSRLVELQKRLSCPFRAGFRTAVAQGPPQPGDIHICLVTFLKIIILG